jgi:ribosomal protein S18 acetylase RimI-like enzyme
MDRRLAAIQQALAQNLGNKLTPELAVGILQAVLSAPEDDLSLNPENFPALEFGEYVICLERLRDCAHEAVCLHQLFWMESGEDGEFNPDYDRLLKLERMGAYAYFTARHNGNLVGQLGAYIQACPHTGRMIATDNVLYVLPEHRVGIGGKLSKYTIQQLTEMGIAELECHTAPDNRVQSAVKRMGFKHTANRYTLKQE